MRIVPRVHRLPIRSASALIDTRLSLPRVAALILALLCVVQVALGGSILLLTCSLFSIALGFIPVRLLGLRSTAGIFFAGLIFFFPASPLLIKTLLLQPIQSNLFLPELSFEVMTVGMAAAAAAGVVVYYCQQWTKSKAVFQPLTPAALELLCYICAAVGILGILGVRLEGGVGRLAALTGGMIFLSLVAATQLALVRSNGKRSLSAISVALLLVCFFLGLSTGSKQAVFGAGLCYLLPVYVYRRKLDPSQVVWIAFASLVLMFLVAPAIQVARGIRETAGPLEIVERTFSVLINLISGNSDALNDLINYDFRENLYYTRYISDTTNAIDRFVFVSYIDALLRFGSGEFLGYGHLMNSLYESVVPDLFNPGQKLVASNGDLILQNVGIFLGDATSQITLPVFGDGYFIGGLAGVFIVTFLSFLLLCGAMIFLLGDIPNNVFAMWWLTLFGFVIASAGASGIAFHVIRVLPVYVILHLVVKRLSRRAVFPSGSRSRPIR